MSLPDPNRDPQFYQGVPVRRAIAFLLDIAIVTILALLLGLVGGVLGFLTLGLGWFVILPILAAIGALYRWATLGSYSATIGMLTLGIEVRTAGGDRLDWGEALVHALGFTLCLYVPPLLFAGWVTVALTREGRMLHDLPLATVVINRPL